MARDFLIFGSQAQKHWFPHARSPKDTDYISREPKMSREVQHYFAPSFEYVLKNNVDDKFVDANFLYTIKLSHFGWNIHWEKTRDDVIFLKKQGCVPDVGLYRDLVKDWKVIHGKKHVSMKNKNSVSFFEDAVQRKYVHDSIHEAIAFYDAPIYTRILKNPETGSVACSEQKFNDLSFDDKILLVLEETCVTALERFLIPTDFGYGRRMAFAHALKKMATTMSSGWMREFVHFEFDKLFFDGRFNLFFDKFIEAEQNNRTLQLNHP